MSDEKFSFEKIAVGFALEALLPKELGDLKDHLEPLVGVEKTSLITSAKEARNLLKEQLLIDEKYKEFFLSLFGFSQGEMLCEKPIKNLKKFPESFEAFQKKAGIYAHEKQALYKRTEPTKKDLGDWISDYFTEGSAIDELHVVPGVPVIAPYVEGNFKLKKAFEAKKQEASLQLLDFAKEMPSNLDPQASYVFFVDTKALQGANLNSMLDKVKAFTEKNSAIWFQANPLYVATEYRDLDVEARKLFTPDAFGVDATDSFWLSLKGQIDASVPAPATAPATVPATAPSSAPTGFVSAPATPATTPTTPAAPASPAEAFVLETS